MSSSFFLERLGHGFQDTAFEFRQLVQEQNAVVREGNLARG